MLLVSNLKLMLVAVGFAVPFAMAGALPEPHRELPSSGDQPALIKLAPGTMSYRVAGDFTRDGKPVEAPLATIRIAQPFDMMKHQVSAADYQRCVDDGGCRTTAAGRPDRPAVQVSWRDADTYATWLSRRT